jgi:transcriptional regulator with XRE-family HTH domain
LGARIKDLRLALGLSPAEFAAAGGVSQAHQYRVESGERVADAIYLLKVATTFKVDLGRLLADDREEAAVDAGLLGVPAREVALPRGKGHEALTTILDAKEQELISNYRAAADEGRRLIEQAGTTVPKRQVSRVKKAA